jgi:thermopsin
MRTVRSPAPPPRAGVAPDATPAGHSRRSVRVRREGSLRGPNWPRAMTRTVGVAIALSVLTVVGTLGLTAALAETGTHVGPSASLPPATVSGATGAPTASTVRAPTVTAPSAAQNRSTLATTVASELAAKDVPQRDVYLPNFEGGGRMDGNVVAPITLAAPAPMGIGDFGVRNTTGTPTPYVLDSTSWEGTFTLTSGDFFYIDNDGPDPFGVQLNTVLTNVTVWGSTDNDYWAQDVMFYTPSQDEVQFIDNIWNFSNPSTAEPASTFYSYNGTPEPPVYYGDEGPIYTATLPFTVHLYTNASLTNVSGREFSTVRFGYDLVSGSGATIGSGVFDTVLFNSNVVSSPSVPLPHFQVNGGHLTPTNFLLYDSELMIGGPGGGSTTQVWAIDATMQLEYNDTATGKYVNDPAAWDAGTDTGETSEGVAESYATPGTVELTGGPSFVVPLWNATPGGNAGQLTFSGTISPQNTFVFVSPGASINNTTVAWAPVLPGGTYRFVLPPGLYDGEALLADHDSQALSWFGPAGTTDTVDISLAVDLDVGLDTPLIAWNNLELASLAYSGTGSVTDPYLLYNNQVLPLSPWFGEMNDFLFPVFPGVLIADTNDYFELEAPPPFTVVLPPALAAELAVDGLPDTNQLQIELYDTDHATVLGGSDISGWMYGDVFFSFPTPYLPAGEVVLWGTTDTLIADNIFEDQGVGIVLLQGSGNTIFGNEFLSAVYDPIGSPAEFGIWEYESGDLIYNNVFDTEVTAYSPSYNMYDGFAQYNVNSWNLSGWQPSSTVNVVNGIGLSGSLLGYSVVCGNWWYDYTPGEALPYDEPFDGPGYEPFIATGGDYCPEGPLGAVGYDATFTETGVTSGTWSVTLAGATGTAAAGDPIVFGMPNGTWQYSVAAEAGLIASPASGSIEVDGGPASASIAFSGSGVVGVPHYLATVAETGLAAGTNWTVTVAGGAPVTTNASAVTLSEPDGTYDFTVAPVLEYQLSDPTGALLVDNAAATAWVRFTPDPGWLNATVSPSNAAVWVGGLSVALVGGGFSVLEAPGTVAIEATLAGYASYFDNVTIAPGQGTSVAVHLTAITTTSPTPTGSSGVAGLSTGQFDALIAGLVVVAAAIVAAAFLLRRRGGGTVAPMPAAAAPTTPEYLEETAPGAPPPS